MKETITKAHAWLRKTSPVSYGLQLAIILSLIADILTYIWSK